MYLYIIANWKLISDEIVIETFIIIKYNVKERGKKVFYGQPVPDCNY